jgi:resuscitation-promoting factor RpfA
MRTHHRRKALLATLALSAGLLAAGPVGGAGPAEAWSRWDEPPTADNLASLRWCESGDDYTIDTGNGYYGAYQFSLETWGWLGYWGYPHEAEPEVQDAAALDLYAYSHWDAWPACSRWLGLKYTYHW